MTLSKVTTGKDNVAIGLGALTNNIGGSNIAIGLCGLCSNTSGGNNVSIGTQALSKNTTGCDNLSFGASTLLSSVSGSRNIAIGPYAANKNVSGSDNITFGCRAGYCNLGSGSTFIGSAAGSGNTTASHRLYIANCQLCTLIYGDFTGNTVTLPTVKICNTPDAGTSTDKLLVWNTTDKCIKSLDASGVLGGAITGATNGLTKIPYGSAYRVKLGGALTGDTSLTGAYTMHICSGAKLNTTCGYQISGTTLLRASTNNINSIYLGCGSGSNGSGGCNVGTGILTLTGITSGFYNVGIGYKALAKSTDGTHNIGIGYLSLIDNIGGDYNIGIGSSALKSNISGNNNIGIGCQVLYDNLTGDFNAAYGAEALCNNTTGCHNIAVGTNSLYTNTTGCDNIGIGRCTGYQSSVGSNNVYIGRYAGSGNTASNKFYLANSKSCTLIYGDFTGNTVTLPVLKLCTTPSSGTCDDKVLVWNETDKTVKQMPYPTGGTAPASNSGTTYTTYEIIGNGSDTEFLIIHDHALQYPLVQVIAKVSPYPTVYTDVVRPNADCVCVRFDNPPASNMRYKVVIAGGPGDGVTSGHTHGNITNKGCLGSTAGLPLITTTGGCITTGTTSQLNNITYGTAAPSGGNNGDIYLQYTA